MKKYSERIAWRWTENSRLECALYSWVSFLFAPQPTECSVEWMGFKNQDPYEEARRHLWLVSWLFSVSSTGNLLLRTMAIGMVAKPGQAYLGRLKHLSSRPWPQVQQRRMRSSRWIRPGRGQGARKGCRGWWSISALGWAHTASVSIWHAHAHSYISRTVISNTETKSEALIKIFFYFKNIFYYKNK